MRRDLDLIRLLMLRLEEYPLKAGVRTSFSGREDRFTSLGYSPDEIAFHLDQISQSGFVNNGGVYPAVGIGYAGFTPAAHDFVDSVRNPDAWKATKDRASKIGNFALGFVIDLAKSWAKSEAVKHGYM